MVTVDISLYVPAAMVILSPATETLSAFPTVLNGFAKFPAFASSPVVLTK
jgi:hypothetical protein